MSHDIRVFYIIHYMKKLLSIILLPLILFSSCDTRLNGNLFSAFKNTDNITVLEAIASGDEELMTTVYNREKDSLDALDPVNDRQKFIQTSLDIADLQSVRSKGVILFLTLIAIEVGRAEVSTIITREIIEDFLYEVTDSIRDVYTLGGEATASQKFMAILGIIVYWYYISDAFDLTASQMIEAYKGGTLAVLLAGKSFEDLDDYDDISDIESDLIIDIADIDLFIADIESDPDYENNPDLEQAIVNTEDIFGLGI
jgi:hypothetical protein